MEQCGRTVLGWATGFLRGLHVLLPTSPSSCAGGEGCLPTPLPTSRVTGFPGSPPMACGCQTSSATARLCLWKNCWCSELLWALDGIVRQGTASHPGLGMSSGYGHSLHPDNQGPDIPFPPTAYGRNIKIKQALQQSTREPLPTTVTM